MNVKQITTLLCLSICCQLQAQDFQVRVKEGVELPRVRVYSENTSQFSYNTSEGVVLKYDIEVRGQCPRVGDKLKWFNIGFFGEQGSTTVLNIPVSGENRSLTGNNGKDWQTHSAAAGFQPNQQQIIDLCNSTATELLQTQSHDEVFGEGFETGWILTTNKFSTNYWCEGGAGFYDFIDDTARIPVRASCEPTGYESSLWLTESDLTLNPISGLDGTCRVNIQGTFYTNYELYVLRSKNSGASLKYRFGFKEGSNEAHSQWWDKTANPVNGGAFGFNYTDRLPGDISNGKVWIEVDFDGKRSVSDEESFSIDCEDALPVQQVQTLDLEFSIEADRTDTVYVNGQLCPSHAILTGNVDAGYPINGSTLIVGSSLADIYINPFSATAGDNISHQKRIALEWGGTSSNSLTLNNQTASQETLSKTLSYGFRVRNSNNDVVKSLAKSDYELYCEQPSANPSLVGSGSLGMLPDHTGGGAPTDLSVDQTTLPNRGVQGDNLILKRGIPANTESGRAEVEEEAGLRSEGELVQAKKPQRLLAHELTHTIQQQGRVSLDSDWNESSSEQKPPAPAGPIPVPYPNVSDGGNTNSRDAHDRLANLETSSQRAGSIYSVQADDHSAGAAPNTPVGAIRTEQLDNKSTLLVKEKVGDRCSPRVFPENAVVEQLRQRVPVECVNNKIVPSEKN